MVFWLINDQFDSVEKFQNVIDMKQLIDEHSGRFQQVREQLMAGCLVN